MKSDYIATQSGNSEIADRFIDTIVDRFLGLASFPYIGHSRDEDFGIGTRSVTAGEYVIMSNAKTG